MKQQHIHFDQHGPAQQQTADAIGHGQGDARDARRRGKIRRREACLAKDTLERNLGIALFRRQRRPLPRQCQPIACDQRAFVHERREHVVEDGWRS